MLHYRECLDEIFFLKSIGRFGSARLARIARPTVPYSKRRSLRPCATGFAHSVTVSTILVRTVRMPRFIGGFGDSAFTSTPSLLAFLLSFFMAVPGLPVFLIIFPFSVPPPPPSSRPRQC